MRERGSGRFVKNANRTSAGSGVSGVGHPAPPKPRLRLNLTREKILAESARVFNLRGYDAATLDEIAQALGVTKAALYYHVRNKEDLLLQCHQKALDIAIDAVRTALAEASEPDEQLRAVLTRYIGGMTDQLAGIVVLLYEGALSPSHYHQIMGQRDEYEQMLRGIVEAGVRSGVFVPCDSRLIGFAILGALNWIPRWYKPGGPRTPKEIASAFSEYFVRGLQTHPSSPAVPPGGSARGGGQGRARPVTDLGLVR
ncbi:MAG: TetR/AcrR family transcriptional regulator [Candidatus Rokubacteria bacterium]|nr:TetR/AcrR family transcriptional regulator [Candidatus Rokubacteria bacterium]